MKTFYAELTVTYEDGITFPGGEPFEDWETYVEIFTSETLKRAKERAKEIVMNKFTEENNPDRCLRNITLTIDDIYETSSDACI